MSYFVWNRLPMSFINPFCYNLDSNDTYETIKTSRLILQSWYEVEVCGKTPIQTVESSMMLFILLLIYIA